MDKNSLIKDICLFCQENANPELALKYKYYFKEAHDNHGLTAPQIHNKVKDLVRGTDLTFAIVKEATDELLRSSKHEEVQFGLLLFNSYGKQYTREDFNRTASWFQFSISNWAQADTLGMFILPKFLERKTVEIDAFKPWLSSPHKFQRRCVPVTLLKILKKQPSFQSLFEFTECLMTDPVREVQQGIGWFLRECWKKKPAETEDFLMKWKDKAPSLILRYATEKMTKEDKIRFKKIK
jgi:3-methyladenine DNA glycosylase AlkD